MFYLFCTCYCTYIRACTCTCIMVHAHYILYMQCTVASGYIHRHINIYTSIVLLGYMYKYNFSRKLRKISIIIEYRQGQYRDIRFSRYYRPKQIPDISDSVFPDIYRYIDISRYRYQTLLAVRITRRN